MWLPLKKEGIIGYCIILLGIKTFLYFQGPYQGAMVCHMNENSNLFDLLVNSRSTDFILTKYDSRSVKYNTFKNY